MNWKKIDLLQLPKDGTEFLVRDGNQGGVMSLVYWDVIHNYWKSKGEPISLQDTEWMSIPKFIPMCTYDCAKCGKDFQDELYPDGPQNLSDNYDFLCPDCKKTIPIKDDELHRKLFALMREIRFAYERYGESCEDSDLNEMNEKQLEIIGMFDRMQNEQSIINFITKNYWENPEDAIGAIRKRINDFENLTGKDLSVEVVKELKELVNRSGFAIPTSAISKIIEENEDLQIHAATSDFCSSEWKNDFEKVKIVMQKIYDAVNESEDFPSEKVLVIKNILNDYYGL